MSDRDKPNEQPAAMQDWSARANAHAARKQAIHPENRAAIFDALERSGIEIVTMTFDGYGDSGQIGEVSVTAGAPHDLAAIKMQQKQAIWARTRSKPSPSRSAPPLRISPTSSWSAAIAAG